MLGRPRHQIGSCLGTAEVAGDASGSAALLLDLRNSAFQRTGKIAVRAPTRCA
jgi:hypothetical protein